MRLLLTFIFLMTSFSAFAQQYIPGEYIVRFKSMNHARAYFADRSTRNIGTHEKISSVIGPMVLLKSNNRNAVASLRANTNIAYIEPNYIYRLPATVTQYDQAVNSRRYAAPNDNRFDELWGLKNDGSKGLKGADINALRAWSATTGLKQVKIAVIDTGVDYTHPDLRANIWTNSKEIPGNGIDDDGNGYVDDVHGYDFSNNDGDPIDDHSHGTHCAGTIAAVHNNKVGVAGVMANASIIPVKFLSRSGSGSTVGAIKSVEYAIRVGAHVMSNSWGGGGKSIALLEAIQAAHKQGIIFVAAAGNNRGNNDTRPMYPASYQVPNVISVAAHDIRGEKASFSNYGLKTVHVAAPGVNILSTVLNGGYKSYSGTSMATPHVSGVVGLVLSAHGLRAAPSMRERLVKTSRKHEALANTSLSGGFVNAYHAIAGKAD